MSRDMSGDGESLEQVAIDMQVKKPGCWDGKFAKCNGECYYEAKHGLNPLGQGFNIFMRCPRAQPKPAVGGAPD